MKKLTLITLLLFPLLGMSQTTKPIEGFLGIKFGSSKADVIAAIKAKGGILSKSSTDDYLVFNNVKLGQRMSEWFSVNLFNNKMYMGIFNFKADQEPQSVDYYNALVSDIGEIYGKGKPYKSFKSPYEDGDGQEVLAISTGHATFFTNWTSDNNNLIQASVKPIKDELYVRLFYIDQTTQAQADAAQKAKEKSDY